MAEASAETPLLGKRTAHHKIRTIECDMQPMEVRTSKTVAAMILGEASDTEGMMFEIGVKSRAGQGLLWSLWFIGACVGISAVGEALPIHFVWVSLLMLPLALVTTFLMSCDVLRSLFSSLDVYVLGILQFAMFVDGIYYCGADRRSIFWGCYLPTMCASLFVDAYPAKYRDVFAKLFFSASLIILIIWNLLLVYKYNAFGNMSKMVSLTFLLHHIADQLTLLVFYCRHLWVSTFTPEHFVMIHASVRTKHEQLELAYDIEDGMEVVRAWAPHRRSEVKLQSSRNEKTSPKGTPTGTPKSRSRSPGQDPVEHQPGQEIEYAISPRYIEQPSGQKEQGQEIATTNTLEASCKAKIDKKAPVEC